MDKLQSLNKHLKSFVLEVSNTGKDHQICFIVGLPRCGSTLLHQLIVSNLRVAYISNLIGKFWMNPVAGAIIHQSLFPKGFKSNFESHFGNTNGIFEPSEFGWFWRHHLNLDENDRPGHDVDLPELNRILSDLVALFNAPLVLDAPYLCNSISTLIKSSNRARVIHLKRSQKAVCNSIFKARQKRYGTLKTFYGAKTTDHQGILQIKDPIEQVVKQVHDLSSEINQQLLNIPSHKIFEINISDLRNQPIFTVSRIGKFLDAEPASNAPDKISFPNRDNVSFFDKKYQKHFELIFEKYFRKKP